MEEQCLFVSSRGLLRSTTIHSPTPVSSSSDLDLSLYKNLQPGSSIYVCNTVIEKFVHAVLPTLQAPFVLVSGDADSLMPYEILSKDETDYLLDHPYLIHWFCQNLTIQHPKCTHLPIGLDYHTLSDPTKQHPWGAGALPIDQERVLMRLQRTSSAKNRIPICYSNFHHSVFGIGKRGDREEVVKTIPQDLVYYEPNFTSRETAWKNQSEFAFVLSPKGGGLDCHRTWEALALGCIPIVKSSGIDPLFEDLPVLIVKDWSDVTKDLLTKTLEEFDKRSWNLDKLTLEYWVKLIKNMSASSKY